MPVVQQKTWIITGGANGIGLAITKMAIAEGAFVCVIDKDKSKGEALALHHGSGKLFFHHGDLSENQTIEDFVQKVLQLRKQVDVLVNNACYSLGGLPECTYEQALEVIKVGALAPYAITRLLQNRFAENASIINITSTRAFMSQGGTESYTMAKGALRALTHGLSVSLRGKVRVNAVAPGWIETGEEAHHTLPDRLQHPAGRVGNVEDIANIVSFLASEKASFITGQQLVVDGGMSSQMIYHENEGWHYSLYNCQQGR